MPRLVFSAAVGEHVAEMGWELFRRLQQGQANLRAVREERLDEVAEPDGTIHIQVEHGHSTLVTISGDRRAPNGVPGTVVDQPVPGRCGVEPAG